VSDIDDTIKDSNVPEPAKLIVNTLLRPFRSTPGMAATYQAWEKRNARFIYLTNSPYQLFSPLNEYLQGKGGYPDGFYYMRYVDLDDLKQDIASLIAVDDKIRLQENPKKHNLIPILEAFPERDFILVGDSTEFDADIYADLFLGQNFPAKFSAPRDGYSDRIKKIYIRDVKNSKRRDQAEQALARVGNKVGNKSVAMFFDEQNPGIQEDAASIFKNA
jgi:phosphatidate phosphatase APP1